MKNPICTPEFDDNTRRLQERVKELRAQLKATQRDATRMTQLGKQIAEDKARVESGDTSPRPKREPVIYGENVKRAVAERNRWRKKADHLIAEGERANHSFPEKVADTTIKLMRLFILSHISALQKLPVAAVVRIASNRLEELAGSATKNIPGYSKIAEQAPRHGAGFSYKADVVDGAKGIKESFRKGMKDQLLKGYDELDATYGDKYMMADEWANLSGRVHSSLKEPAKLDEFYRSFYKRSQHAYQQVIKRGGTEAEAQEFVNRPSTQFMIGEASYKDAKEAIMQGDNALIDNVDNFTRGLSRSSTGGKIFEKIFNFLVPIKKVPANIVKETSSYIMGGVKAAAATWNAAKAAKSAGKAWHEMTPEQADYIAKNVKKQTVGIPLMVAGYLAGPAIVGGVENFFDDERKKINDYYSRIRNHKPLAGHIRVGNTDLNANFSHASQMVLVQAGAQFRAMREKEKGGSIFDGLKDMLSIAGSYAIEESPVVGSLTKSYEYAQKNRKGGSFLGNEVKSTVVPGALQDIAKYQDYDPNKDKNRNSPIGHFLDVWGGQFSAKTRKPRNIGEDVKTGVPGLRERVPK